MRDTVHGLFDAVWRERPSEVDGVRKPSLLWATGAAVLPARPVDDRAL